MDLAELGADIADEAEQAIFLSTQIKEIDERLAAGITTFSFNGQPGRDLQNALWERKIRVRAQGGSRGVRLSAHLYVSPSDIDRVLEVTAAMKKVG